MKTRLRVLVVGQTPPPYHGQAIMTDVLLAGRYPNAKITAVRMSFSERIEDVGMLRLGKVGALVRLIARIYFWRMRSGADVLYYPPAGPNYIPMIRDILVLVATRWMFRLTIFHFHAGGLSELYEHLHPVMQWWFRRAFWEPDVAIRVAPNAPQDGRAFHARRDVVVPNAVPDAPGGLALFHHSADQEGVPIILYVGAIRESKGVTDLIEACAALRERGTVFELHLMGRIVDGAFQKTVIAKVSKSGIQHQTRYLGELTGQSKTNAFRRARVLCLPSFYESETFGLVLIEAMCAGLPVVATRWRGLSDVVEDGFTGYLVEMRDTDALAERLDQLLSDSTLARRLGENGRREYEERYKVEVFWDRMSTIFEELKNETSDR